MSAWAPLANFYYAWLRFLRAKHDFPKLNHAGTEPNPESYNISEHTARIVRREAEIEFGRGKIEEPPCSK